MKTPSYYEVKNWAELQHYTKRNPPWIKLYRRLLKEGDFQMLTELEQWQLVRIWLVSAEEHPGGWIPNDQRWLRVMTGSSRPLPLKKLVEHGWLIPRDASAHASAAASTDARNDVEFDPLSCPPEKQRYIKNLPSFLPTSSLDGKEGGFEIGNILKEVDAA